nr:dTDP-4-dehydrorhamnose 3,5-epimerase [Salsipaludibacter albus]
MDGVAVLEPDVFADDRGYFLESWNARSFVELVGEDVTFVQDNHSHSATGVLRGLHHQVPPSAQGKLVRCVRGRVWDVAVDVRRDSPTLGDWVAEELSEHNQRQLWISTGFAHGFLVLEGPADVLYKATDFYDPVSERSIAWDDPRLAIDWPLDTEPVLSAKDAAAPRFDPADLP